MRARPVEQPEAAVAVAKEDQVLAEQAHRLDLALRHARIEARIEFVEQRRRLPVAAQQRAAWRAGADPSDEVVLFGVHRVAAAGKSKPVYRLRRRCL